MKYFNLLTSTPQLVTLLIVVFIFLILLLVSAGLILRFRNTEMVKSLIWFPKEILKLYSNQESYFSKKRIEGGAAFIFSLGFTICYSIINIHVITPTEQVILITPWLLICGYNVSKTQEEKLNTP